MQPESILQSDLLDILFENRNKEYGAYELRSQYKRRMQGALLSVLGMLAAICMFYLLMRNHLFKGELAGPKPVIDDSLHIIEVVFQEKPPKPSAPAVKIKIPSHPVANAVPVIVKQEINSKPSPSVEQLDRMDPGVTGTDTGTGMGTADGPGDRGTGKSVAATTETAVENEIVARPDFMPEFPGGMDALRRFLSKNLRMPEGDLSEDATVRVMARFIVDRQGAITGVEFEQSGGNAFDNEVKRVLAKMPRWKPGMQHGKPVPVYFSLPVLFQSVSDR